jgi:hypothetical protein
MTQRNSHLPWCGPGCAWAVTGVHESRPVPVAPRGTDPVAVTIALERLAEAPPVNLVVLELVQDDEAVQYRLPPGQVRALQHALRGALRRLATG